MTSQGRKAESKRAFGQKIEQAARGYLKDQGFKAVAENFQCKTGELDLIMLDGDTLVFIEVRFRKSSRFGDGADSITATKQRKLIRTAQYFLQRHPNWQQHACRFDVVSVSVSDNTRWRFNSGYEFDWIKDAFWS